MPTRPAHTTRRPAPVPLMFFVLEYGKMNFMVNAHAARCSFCPQLRRGRHAIVCTGTHLAIP